MRCPIDTLAHGSELLTACHSGAPGDNPLHIDATAFEHWNESK
jgi:hypothetical protein